MFLSHICGPVFVFVSGRRLTSILIFVLLLVGCSGRQAIPAPGIPADDVKLTARVILPTLQAADTPTAAKAAGAMPTTPVPPTATARPSPSLTPIPSSSPTPTLEPASVLVTPEPVRLTRLAWSPDGSLLAVGSPTGVYLFDTATWQEARFIPMQGNAQQFQYAAKDLAFSFDGKLLATEGTEGRGLQVWRVPDGSFAYTLKGNATLAASPAEGLWATFGDERSIDGSLRLWRTSDGQLVREIPTGLEFPSAIAFSPDGRLIVAGGTDSQPRVWQVADGQRVATLNWHGTEFFSWVDLAFRPSSSTVVAAGTDDVLLFWDGGSGAVIQQLTGPNDMGSNPVVNRVSFSPDGNLFATSHSGGPGRPGGSVQLWQADGTRGQSWQIDGMPGDVAFSPDGALLAAVDERTIYLWRPSDGSPVRKIQPDWHPGILPTPTSTPLHEGLNLSNDWKEYVWDQSPRAENNFKLRYPPTWQLVSGKNEGVTFMSPSPAGYDVGSAMIVDLTVGGYCGPWRAGRDPEALEWIKSTFHLGEYVYGADEAVYVSGGEWPLVVPGVYGEFDVSESLSLRGRGQVRAIDLITRLTSGGCVYAYLIDEAEDISEQDRLDFSRMLASIELEDPQRPFAMAQPTFMPPSNPGPIPTQAPRTTDKSTSVPSPAPLASATARACAMRVAGDLADLYQQSRLGCPTSNAKVEWGAWETFERGAMLWRSAADAIYAFSQQPTRSWLEIPDQWSGQEVKSRGDPPAGLQTPVRGFGYVWGEQDDVFALLGWATDEERGFCFTFQPFEHGFLLRSKAVQSCTPENNYNQATSPDWKPVTLAVYEGGWSDRRPVK